MHGRRDVSFILLTIALEFQEIIIATMAFAGKYAAGGGPGVIDGAAALLGVEEMKIPAPLRCGDTVQVKVKVLAKRETSKPDRGIVTSEQQVINQKGEILLQYTVNRMIRRRPKE